MESRTSYSGGRPRVVFIGNFLPRKCGIATFTTDLHGAVGGHLPARNLAVVAMNNTPEGYDYPDPVVFGIQQDRPGDYIRAARFINESNAELVCVQHEFGIFGGEAGSYLGRLLAELEKPVVTTLHTVLERPEPAYRRSMLDLIRCSDRLLVMSKRAVGILREVYGVAESQVRLIHHGTPDVPFTDPDEHKAQFGVSGRPVVLTFGLLSPNKGIEHAIAALPPVVERFPNLAYVVLGATHPEVRRRCGERYREGLEQQVADLGLRDNVIFRDRFVETDELVRYLCASDVYLTPYLSREQIVSGTLAYAVATGRAIISTPYWYAEEMLADGRGILVGARDTGGLAQTLLQLLGDEALRRRLREHTYEFGRRMVWREVGRRYVTEFERVLDERRRIVLARAARQVLVGPAARAPRARMWRGLPELNLNHLLALTDDRGLVQHTSGPVPDLRHGYSADDVGRALIVLARAHTDDADQATSVSHECLGFLERAQTESGRFHNFMDARGRFTDDGSNEDTLGRVVWGLGTLLRHAEDGEALARAASLLQRAAPRLGKLTCPRAKAYAVCGLAEVLDGFSDNHILRHTMETLAGSLVEIYEINRDGEWHWFEDIVTYGNAILPHALLAASALSGDAAMREVGLESLDFLIRSQWNGDYFDFVGNEGWWVKGGPRAVYSQQPIEPGYLTAACVTAHAITGREQYLISARRCFDWFMGRNRLGVPLYDGRTGAVADGLDPGRVNLNRGAEAVITFLLALLSLSTLGLPVSEQVSA
ncbi:MAG: glycosyltransferase [Verrucomicrobia bacterium]|nr:glycosyltransferase [Verrucomicrobiota bacterium]